MLANDDNDNYNKCYHYNNKGELAENLKLSLSSDPQNPSDTHCNGCNPAGVSDMTTDVARCTRAVRYTPSTQRSAVALPLSVDQIA